MGYPKGKNPAAALALLLVLSRLASAAALPWESCLAPGCHTVAGEGGLRHPPGGECTLCHRPGDSWSRERHDRGSFESPESPREECLRCHEDLRSLIASGVLHPPFAEGDCTACHSPHRSSSPALLSLPYPESAYGSYDRDASGLCWSCHEDGLAEEKFSDAATSFRLARRNFHYSHLHKRKGITCRACHTPHGGPQRSLIRSGPPPGASGWIDTMVFVSGAGGGTCSGGCHTAISYTR